MSNHVSLRTSILAVLAGGAVTATLAFGWAARAGRSAATGWEYHCVLPPGAVNAGEPSAPRTPHDLAHHGDTGDHPSEKVLNHLGSQGWELVAIDPANHHYCFKRPLAR